MKRWGTIAAALLLAAALIWAGARLSTGVAQLMNLVRAGETDEEGVGFLEDIEPARKLPVETWMPTEADFDSVQGVPEAEEDVAPRSTDYLNDGDEERPVDKTIEELAEELLGEWETAHP